MLSVSNKYDMLNAIILSVSNKSDMLYVVMLSVSNKSDVLNAIMLSVSNKPDMLCWVSPISIGDTYWHYDIDIIDIIDIMLSVSNKSCHYAECLK